MERQHQEASGPATCTDSDSNLSWTTLRTPSDKISIIKLNEKELTISINGDNPRCNLPAEQCIDSRDHSTGKYSMEVTMRTKKLKTALGLMEKGKSFTYMRNDPIGEGFVSFGGAGWIHPQEVRTTRGYSQGDVVKVTLDFSKPVHERVEFSVNNKLVGVAPWTYDTVCFGLSVDANGVADLGVTFQNGV